MTEREIDEEKEKIEQQSKQEKERHVTERETDEEKEKIEQQNK